MKQEQTGQQQHHRDINMAAEFDKSKVYQEQEEVFVRAAHLYPLRC